MITFGHFCLQTRYNLRSLSSKFIGLHTTGWNCPSSPLCGRVPVNTIWDGSVWTSAYIRYERDLINPLLKHHMVNGLSHQGFYEIYRILFQSHSNLLNSSLRWYDLLYLIHSVVCCFSAELRSINPFVIMFNFVLPEPARQYLCERVGLLGYNIGNGPNLFRSFEFFLHYFISGALAWILSFLTIQFLVIRKMA